jgi:hypothetical protein
MNRTLSLEQTPPFSVPLRFFLTAPFFAAIAGVLLLWYGPEVLTSRWSSVTLALTHLLVLGFLTMSMIGALLQILQVVAGVVVPQVRLTAGIAHLFLTLGTIALSTAFLTSESNIFKLALPALLTAFVWLLGACCYGLWRTEASSATLTAIRLSLVALAVAVGLGATVASAFAWPRSLPLMQLTDFHAAWGLLGWIGLLIIGVAYQVVPMFQITPIYPRSITRWLVWGLFLLLILWTFVTTFLPITLRTHSTWLPFVIVTGYAAFSITTLYLLWHRKRPKPEASTLFWYTGLLSLLGCAGLWLTGKLLPDVAQAPSYPLTLGILFIVGFGYSVTNGMLYKIVPFLVWYHLQNQLEVGVIRAPNVKQIVPDRFAKRQFCVHVAALLLLIEATVWPDQIARMAAVAFIISTCWLWMNLLGAVRIYHGILKTQAKQHVGAAAITA